MSNRFVLNNISYHGAGAIKEIPDELTRRGFSKAFVATDADLVRFGVTKKVTDLLDEAGIAWEMFSDIKPNPTIENVQAGVTASGPAAPIASWPWAAAAPWTPRRALALLPRTPSSPTW